MLVTTAAAGGKVVQASEFSRVNAALAAVGIKIVNKSALTDPGAQEPVGELDQARRVDPRWMEGPGCFSDRRQRKGAPMRSSGPMHAER